MAKHRNLTGTPRTRPPMKHSRSSQFNVSKGFRLQWPILVFMRINLWEEFVKVWHLQMAKMSLNMTRKFKITDFLLGFGFRSRRLFCRYCYVSMSVPISYMSWNVAWGLSVNQYRWRCRAILPHLLLKHIFRCVQAWILIEHVKSGADRTLYGWKLQQQFIPMARHRIWQERHGHALSMKNSRSSQFNISKGL